MTVALYSEGSVAAMMMMFYSSWILGIAMKKICLKVMLYAVFSAVVLSVCGCHGLGETRAERAEDRARQLRLEGQMLVDDIDAILLFDRTSRLSEYTVR